MHLHILKTGCHKGTHWQFFPNMIKCLNNNCEDYNRDTNRWVKSLSMHVHEELHFLLLKTKTFIIVQ